MASQIESLIIITLLVPVSLGIYGGQSGTGDNAFVALS